MAWHHVRSYSTHTEVCTDHGGGRRLASIIASRSHAQLARGGVAPRRHTSYPRWVVVKPGIRNEKPREYLSCIESLKYTKPALSLPRWMGTLPIPNLVSAPAIVQCKQCAHLQSCQPYEFFRIFTDFLCLVR